MNCGAIFKCSKCKASHPYKLYAVAQLSQGHDVIFSGCACGSATTLTPAKYRRDRAKHKARKTP